MFEKLFHKHHWVQVGFLHAWAYNRVSGLLSEKKTCPTDIPVTIYTLSCECGKTQEQRVAGHMEREQN